MEESTKPYNLRHCRDLVEASFGADGKVSKIALIKAIRDAYQAGVTDTKVAWFDAQIAGKTSA